ncbi:mitochondrial fission ELM1 family protein [Roseibium aggregatum]|uniref:Mitochondrial fission ELM1 family protein n=1 Tax=Roseibium aggregatum TaxID=187304 RepID=A0A939EJG9_9HYPH|nr:mitochondrial fission ELM1 family protein [Roseibium aggregatum]MBN9673537.1 mitochondrial fission ELM1 family protein [Roseibium aggregatum]
MQNQPRLTPHSVWVLTDGKAGDLVQCTGVAAALGCAFETRRIAPKPPFSWWLPFGPTDPREWESRPDSPIAPPWPDIAIASGRRAAAYLRRIKRRSSGKTFTVFLKDPRTGPKSADLIWVPEHDKLRGPNVLVTPTSPHKLSRARLDDLRSDTGAEILKLTAPRVAVLIGGDSRHHTFTEADQNRLLNALRELARTEGASLMITGSRRTPAGLAYGLAGLAKTGGHLYWTGEAPNPLGAYLANADAVVATADSTNMIGEAAVTGKPVHVFHPSGGHAKITRFLDNLQRLGVVHPFPGPLKTTTYEPIDATPVIARRILDDYAAFRQRDTKAPVG